MVMTAITISKPLLVILAYFLPHCLQKKSRTSKKKKEEIKELQDKCFTIGDKKKTIRIFLGGDYQFLCENYGHPGAASTHFCLFCPITLQEKRETQKNGLLVVNLVNR